MNYLAHLYLSGQDYERRVGNFIGDYVKGRQWINFPKPIANGILIHRFIDDYSDNHPLFKASKAYFSPDYKLYSGVITDMIFDHYLARNWKYYSTISLDEYLQEFYRSIKAYDTIIPSRIYEIIPKLIASRRIQKYETKEGILEAIHLMSRYTSLPSKDKQLETTLYKHDDEIEKKFLSFFKQMKEAIENKYEYKIEDTKKGNL